MSDLLPSSQPAEVWLSPLPPPPAGWLPAQMPIHLRPVKPRVWPIFVAFVALMALSIGSAAVILIVGIFVTQGPNVLTNPVELQRAIPNALRNPWILFSSTAGSTTGLIGASILG